MTSHQLSAQCAPFRRASHQRIQLILATGAFAVSFAIFGSVAAMMPILSRRLGLSDTQAGLALAVPVLLGSIGRVPMGILTDRFGGRVVYIAVMALSIVPVFLIAWAERYWQVLLFASLTGIPLALFPVGVAFVCDWYPPRRHGSAIGLLTLGSLGHSMALFIAPLAVIALGYKWGFWIFAASALSWLLLFATWAEDAPKRGWGKSIQFREPLTKPTSWVLALFYFLTLGCFLSLAAILPLYLSVTFGMHAAQAGLHAAGFVALATIARPLGGVLSDHVGGRQILLFAFPLVAATALLLTSNSLFAFSFGVLGTGIAIGLGSGAVFKLVPEHFPDSVGSVTGLVGAVGGLGGFFPPIVMGYFRSSMGNSSLGFVLLAFFALTCFALCVWLLPTGRRGTPKRPRPIKMIASS